MILNNIGEIKTICQDKNQYKVNSCVNVDGVYDIIIDNDTSQINENNTNTVFVIKILHNGIINFKIGYDNTIGVLQVKHGVKIKKINRIDDICLKVSKEDELVFEIDKKYIGNELDSCLYSHDNKYHIYLSVNNDDEPYYKKIINNKIDKIVIIQNKIISSIGEYFKTIFESKGYECVIKNKLEIIDCLNSNQNTMYIILINYSEHYLLPQRYIYYQIEQKNSVFLTNPNFLSRVINMMKEAEQVWEYSKVASQIYSKYCENKLIWIPMPFVYSQELANNTRNFDDSKYDIFFFGHKNTRREKILEELSSHFKIKVGWGCYGSEKIKYICKSKIILNIHFYKETGLETCRINEILNYNKLIISEKSPLDVSNTNLYNDLVVFTYEIDDDMTNINLMIATIKNYLSKSKYEKKCLNIQKNIKKLSNKINDTVSNAIIN